LRLNRALEWEKGDRGCYFSNSSAAAKTFRWCRDEQQPSRSHFRDTLHIHIHVHSAHCHLPIPPPCATSRLESLSAYTLLRLQSHRFKAQASPHKTTEKTRALHDNTHVSLAFLLPPVVAVLLNSAAATLCVPPQWRPLPPTSWVCTTASARRLEKALLA
jgi:hypothetical protein